MNRKLVFVFVVVLAVLLPVMLVGQGKKGGGKKGGEGKMSAAPMNVTGCFNKGADADHFVLKDDKGKEYVVMGDNSKLAGHANNHNVTLTGTMGKDGGKDVLKVTELKMNSVCK